MEQFLAETAFLGRQRQELLIITLYTKTLRKLLSDETSCTAALAADGNY